MSKVNAKKLCRNVRKEIRPMAITLAESVIAMSEKIEKTIPEYNEMPLCVSVIDRNGNESIKANPGIQEFRANVREFSQALNALNRILGEQAEETQVLSLDELRKNLKIC